MDLCRACLRSASLSYPTHHFFLRGTWYLISKAALFYFPSDIFLLGSFSFFQPATSTKPFLPCLALPYLALPCRARSSILASCIRDGTKILTAVASPMPPPNLTPHTCPDQAPNKRRFVRGEILRGVFHIKAAKNKKHSEFTMVSREREKRS